MSTTSTNLRDGISFNPTTQGAHTAVPPREDNGRSVCPVWEVRKAMITPITYYPLEHSTGGQCEGCVCVCADAETRGGGVINDKAGGNEGQARS